MRMADCYQKARVIRFAQQVGTVACQKGAALIHDCHVLFSRVGS